MLILHAQDRVCGGVESSLSLVIDRPDINPPAQVLWELTFDVDDGARFDARPRQSPAPAPAEDVKRTVRPSDTSSESWVRISRPNSISRFSYHLANSTSHGPNDCRHEHRLDASTKRSAR